MMSKKIISKTQKLYYHSVRKGGYIPKKESSGLYFFKSKPWSKGVIPPSLVDFTTSKITKTNDGFDDVSLTHPLTQHEIANKWRKIKIIDTIKIDIDKNCNPEFRDAIAFSILQVKKKMFEKNGSWVTDDYGLDGIVTPEQLLVDATEFPKFINSIEFTGLNYDLPYDEDFALIDDINVDNVDYKLLNGTKRYGEANLPYISYKITVVYSEGYL